MRWTSSISLQVSLRTMSWICSPTRERNSIGKDRLRTVPIHLIGAKLDTRGAFTDSTSREPKARAERRGPAFRLAAALAALEVLHDRLEETSSGSSSAAAT